MLNKSERVMVCVSGGPDSVAMLYVLKALSRTEKYKLHIAHLNHMIRGKESQRDMEFVKSLSKKLNIPIALGMVDVKKESRNVKLSLEETAREIRYDFFEKTAEKLRIRKIATAHSEDDQAETVLMRVIKGTGLQGLSGIPPVRRKNKVCFIRPLLGVGRKDILAFLRKNRIKYRTDSSNRKPIYLRNKIRIDVIPRLEKLNPALKKSLKNLSELAAGDFGYINRMASEVWRKMGGFDSRKGKCFLKLKDYGRLDESLKRALFRIAILKVKPDLRRITFRNWLDFNRLAAGAKSGSSADLPGDIKAVIEHGNIAVMKKTKAGFGAMPSGAISVPGQTILPLFKIVIRAEIINRVRRIKVKRAANTEYFDFDKLKTSLKVRARRRGDRMAPFGMKKSKKLHDIFIDGKIPVSERDLAAVVTCGKKIIWVYPGRRAEAARVTPGTKRILKLTINKL
jgi:tRNA(Ile)-lysidine synthase